MTNISHNHRSGFTLIELSIAIVIIGLIIGGILVGRDMIRSSELRSIATDIGKYQTSINAFRTKYNAMPGDLTNATSYWPSGSTGNGNGNGQIGWSGENWRSWQHLTLSGLVPGTYNGIADSGGSTPGINVPLIRERGTIGIDVYYMTNSGNAASATAHGFIIGAVRSGNTVSNSGFSTKDSYYLDAKMDDNDMANGKMRAFTAADAGTACDSAAPLDSILCYLVFHQI